MTRFGHCQFHRSKLSVRPTSIALVRPSLARSHKIKSMVAIKNSTITHNEADDAARIDQLPWIVGYETKREGCAGSRLKKILRGMNNLSMVGDDAWNNYIQDAATIMHAAISEDVLDTVPSWLYHPTDNALAKVEEAWLAVGEKARDPSVPKWRGQEVAVTDDSTLAAVKQLLSNTGGLIIKAQPQGYNRKGATAMGQADGKHGVVKQRNTRKITAAMRLRGGGGNEGGDKIATLKRSWQGVGGEWGGSTTKAQRTGDNPRGWGQPTRQQEPESGYTWVAQHGKDGGMVTAARPSQHPPMPPHLQRIMQQGSCTSQEGHRLLADCHHHPPRCPAAWCGRVGCTASTKCDCACNNLQPESQGARDARLQLQNLGSSTTTPGGEQHHVAERWPGPQERGVANNSWRGGVTDHYGKAQSGWGKVADAFIEDPRWQDYMRVVESGLTPGLTWWQYVAAVENTRRWSNHEERHWTHHLARAPPEPQAQAPRSQAPRWMEAAIPVPDKKALRLKEHRRRVALISGDDEEAKCKQRIMQRRRILEEAERRAREARWSRNRGQAAEAVPELPKELWAKIFGQGRKEREQHTAWAAWANARLMQLVVVWFRGSGQRNSRWLGSLTGKNGGISCADTANIATRFAPWCRAILRPGEANEPLNYAGSERCACGLRQHLHPHALHDELPRVPQRHRETPAHHAVLNARPPPRQRHAKVHPRAAGQRRRQRRR